MALAPAQSRHRSAAPEAPVYMPNVPDDDDDEEEEEAYHPPDPGSPSDDAPSPSASDGSNDNSSNDGSGDEDAGGDAAAGEDAGDGGNPQAITATQLQRAMLKEQRETNRLNRLLANLHMHHLVLPHQAQRGADLAA